MKKIFTLFVILCTAVCSYAYKDPTRLTISSVTSTYLRIMIDGNKYTSNKNDFSISDLSNGLHNVKIFQQKKGFNKKAAYVMIYNNNIMIKAMMHTDIIINRFGKAFVDEVAMGKNNYYNNDKDWDNTANNDWDNLTPVSISAESFNLLKSAVNNQSFDADKLAVAKQGIGSNYFTCNQVKELMELLLRDENKLEVAKYSYQFTVDKNNYFILNDAFTFSSTKQEFIKYMGTVQN